MTQRTFATVFLVIIFAAGCTSSSDTNAPASTAAPSGTVQFTVDGKTYTVGTDVRGQYSLPESNVTLKNSVDSSKVSIEVDALGFTGVGDYPVSLDIQTVKKLGLVTYQSMSGTPQKTEYITTSGMVTITKFVVPDSVSDTAPDNLKYSGKLSGTFTGTMTQSNPTDTTVRKQISGSFTDIPIKRTY